jgi:hypothetical protein
MNVKAYASANHKTVPGIQELEFRMAEE